jgi:ubiquinone/menaquinone biosynthesis C-methylase UbiE
MISEVDSFYRKVLCEIITDKTASILVCGGDITDKEVFASLGYLNVVISGMERRTYDYRPYVWREENVESLTFPDESVDYAVIHAAIHHTHLPHKVLTELYRVSKKGALAFESRDSLLIRIAERFGLTQTYEVAGSYQGMGVNGTDIPNFIYRWTEREIRKTISSYSPFF